MFLSSISQHSSDFLKKLYLLKNPETGEVEPYGTSFSETLQSKLVDLKLEAIRVEMLQSLIPKSK